MQRSRECGAGASGPRANVARETSGADHRQAASSDARCAAGTPSVLRPCLPAPASRRFTHNVHARPLGWGGRPSSRGGLPFEESPDITGQGGREPDPGKPAGKCHRKDTADGARERAQARVKWCGKSAPAPWRHGGQANPTRCKAKQDRLQVARRGPGRPRQMDGCSRQNPAYRSAKENPRDAGVFYVVAGLASRRCGRASARRRVAGGGRARRRTGRRTRRWRRVRPSHRRTSRWLRRSRGGTPWWPRRAEKCGFAP